MDSSELMRESSYNQTAVKEAERKSFFSFHVLS